MGHDASDRNRDRARQVRSTPVELDCELGLDQRNQSAAVPLQPAGSSSSSNTVRTSAGGKNPTTGSGRRAAPGSAPYRPTTRPRSLAGSGTSGSSSSSRRDNRPPHDRLDRLDHVGGFRDQCRALLDQVIGAGKRAGSSGEPGTANTSRPCSLAKPCRDERARAERRLDHDDAERGAGDQPVAPWKVVVRAPCPSGISEITAPKVRIASKQIGMFRRIDLVVTAREHRDRAALDRGAMRRLVDAAGQDRKRQLNRRH